MAAWSALQRSDLGDCVASLHHPAGQSGNPVHAVRMVRHRRATKLSSWTVEDIDGGDVGSLVADPSHLGAMDL